MRPRINVDSTHFSKGWIVTESVSVAFINKKMVSDLGTGMAKFIIDEANKPSVLRLFLKGVWQGRLLKLAEEVTNATFD